VWCGVCHLATPCLQIKALEISENRWKPTKPTDDEEKVYKQIKGLLNKLTLEKFDKLYQELLEIGIRCVSVGRAEVPRGWSSTLPWVCLLRPMVRSKRSGGRWCEMLWVRVSGWGAVVRDEEVELTGSGLCERVAARHHCFAASLSSSTTKRCLSRISLACTLRCASVSPRCTPP